MKKLNILFAALLSILFVSCDLAHIEAYYIESDTMYDIPVTYNGTIYKVNKNTPLFIGDVSSEPEFDETFIDVDFIGPRRHNDVLCYTYTLSENRSKYDSNAMFNYKFINNSEKDILIKYEGQVIIDKLSKNSITTKKLKGLNKLNILYYVNNMLNIELQPRIEKSFENDFVICNIY